MTKLLWSLKAIKAQITRTHKSTKWLLWWRWCQSNSENLNFSILSIFSLILFFSVLIQFYDCLSFSNAQLLYFILSSWVSSHIECELCCVFLACWWKIKVHRAISECFYHRFSTVIKNNKNTRGRILYV